MAISKAWLEQVRQKNREKFGMAGMSGMAGLGSSMPAQDVAATLDQIRQRQRQAEVVARQQEAAVAAQEALARDPRQAALLALPKIEIPEPQPIPREVIWIGGAVAVGFMALIAASLLRK